VDARERITVYYINYDAKSRCEIDDSPNVFEFCSSLAASFRLKRSRLPRTHNRAGLPSTLRIFAESDSEGKTLARILDVSQTSMLENTFINFMGFVTDDQKELTQRNSSLGPRI
jgi:hypothetical protein